MNTATKLDIETAYDRARAMRHLQSLAAEASLASMIEDIRAKGSVVLVSSDIQALECAQACARAINQGLVS